MGADSYVLFLLLQLIIAVLLGIMDKLELALATIGGGGLWFSLSKAIEPNANPLWWVAVIIFAVLMLICLGDYARRIVMDKTKKLLAELSDLRQKGVKLLHKGLTIRNDSDKDSWWQEIVKWKTDVCSKMREIRPVDSDNWGLLGTYESQLFNPTPYCYDLNDKLTQLSIWLERLRQYIDDRTRK